MRVIGEYREGYKVARVITIGNPQDVAFDIIVQAHDGQFWQELRAFNSMSDDYALTHAREVAQAHVKGAGVEHRRSARSYVRKRPW